ncbi:hypothetical protein G7Y79_00049g084730 [Physcia stellaris]|nr:hypothetical protein G7Y79_00049g084730 [Physcia stellaris]
MPSRTLLAFLFGIMTFSQGTIALPASSTSSLIPDSTTTLRESVQATQTMAAELRRTSDSTLASPGSDSNGSESHILSRDDVAWIEFYNDDRCGGPRVGEHLVQERGHCANIDHVSAAASHIWIHWGTEDSSMAYFGWFKSMNCEESSLGGNIPNKGDSKLGHGICIKRLDGMSSVQDLGIDITRG